MSFRYAFDFYFGGAAVLVASGLIFMAALSRGISYQCHSPRGSMVFRSPLGLRLWMILLVLWLFFCIVLLVFNDINVVSNLFVLLPAVCVAGGSAVLLASKRSELHLDLRQNTYRFREKTLFRSREHSGSWQDFQGVFVRTTQLEFGEACHVGLAWQKERASTLYLGFYDDPVKAEMFAMEVAKKLSLPIVPAPELGKSPVLLG